MLDGLVVGTLRDSSQLYMIMGAGGIHILLPSQFFSVHSKTTLWTRINCVPLAKKDRGIGYVIYQVLCVHKGGNVKLDLVMCFNVVTSYESRGPSEK